MPESVHQQLKDHLAAEEKLKDDAIVKKETHMETIIDAQGRNRSLARGTDGRWKHKTKVSLRHAMRRTQQLLERPWVELSAEELKTLSARERLNHAIIKNVIEAEPDNLVGATHGAKWVHDQAYGAKAEDRETEEPRGNDRGFVIIMDHPLNLGVPMAEPEKPSPKVPSWVRGEVIQQNGPPTPEPAVDAWKAEIDAARGPKPAPSDNSVAERIAKAQQRFDR